jgi:hypothetical protein
MGKSHKLTKIFLIAKQNKYFTKEKINCLTKIIYIKANIANKVKVKLILYYYYATSIYYNDHLSIITFVGGSRCFCYV